MTLSLKKCEFLIKYIDYLVHVISPGCLEVSTGTIEALRGLELPTNVRELRSFFSLCNVFRHIVLNYALADIPVNKTLFKGQMQTFEARAYDKMRALERQNKIS